MTKLNKWIREGQMKIWEGHFPRFCQTANLELNEQIDGEGVTGYPKQLLADLPQFYNSETNYLL
jgi:hypothetical protein